MKKLYLTPYILIFMLTLCITPASAQTVPGSAFPVAGDVFTLIEADTAGVLPGATGAGVTWDFSALTTSFGSQVDSFMAPSATPYGAVFPLATVAVHELIPITGTNYYVYYYNNNATSTYERIGNVLPDTVIYSDHAEEFPYPLTSTTTFSGTYYAHYNTTGGSATEAGSGTGGADGTGTLILPTGTYHNVIRAHSIRMENDTTYTPSATAALQLDNYYEWYQPNSYFPILSIQYSSYSVMGFNVYNRKTVAYRAGYTASGINGVSAETKEVLLFPNPATNKVSVLYDMANAGETQISIYDLTGRLLLSQSHISGAGMQNVSVNIAELRTGMYEVKVSNAQNTSSVKMQIVK